MNTKSLITKSLTLALLGAAVTLTACDTVKPAYTGRVDQAGRGNYPRVTVQGELSPFIGIDAPIVEPSDVLKVTVPIRLLTDAGNPSSIQYRILFFNKNGSPARGGDMNWRFVHLPPRQQVFLTGNSLDSDAVDWRCEVRLAK